MVHHYTLFVDEAGDDQVKKLKPDFPNGNSEWLCLGGYLVRSENVSDLTRRRDEILVSIGGVEGGVLHYRKFSDKNRSLVTEKLASNNYPARAFVVCSFKKAMIGYHNERAERASVYSRDALYNFVCRLLLERVTPFVKQAAQEHGIEKPILKIVMATRRGHHFGHFKAYVQTLINQVTAGSTYLSTRAIEPDVLRWSEIVSLPADQVPGLQLADVVASSFFHSIEQSPSKVVSGGALNLLPVMTKRRFKDLCANEGVTLYPATRALNFMTPEQCEFFAKFGYDVDGLKRRSAVSFQQEKPQAERLWTKSRMET